MLRIAALFGSSKNPPGVRKALEVGFGVNFNRCLAAPCDPGCTFSRASGRAWATDPTGGGALMPARMGFAEVESTSSTSWGTWGRGGEQMVVRKKGVCEVCGWM